MFIARNTNIYMDATTHPATEHFQAGREACGFRRATADGVEDMTPMLRPSRHRVDTFLVNEPLLPWSLRESVWARGMAHHLVIGSDHLPVRLALPGLLNAAGHAAMPAPYSHVRQPPPVRRRGCARPELPVGDGHRPGALAGPC